MKKTGGIKGRKKAGRGERLFSLFWVVLCLCLLAWGLLTAFENTRALGFNQAPLVSFSGGVLEIGSLRLDFPEWRRSFQEGMRPVLAYLKELWFSFLERLQ